VPAGEVVDLPAVSGDTLELLVELAPGSDGVCGVVVRRSPDDAEQTRIAYDAGQDLLIVDRTRSSLALGVDHNPHAAPLTLEPGEPLRLHIFIDRSVLEIFANARVSITTRIYPTRPDSLGVGLLAEAADARLEALDAWQLRSIWDS
jgi:beta-fructofuranosidase